MKKFFCLVFCHLLASDASGATACLVNDQGVVAALPESSFRMPISVTVDEYIAQFLQITSYMTGQHGAAISQERSLPSTSIPNIMSIPDILRRIMDFLPLKSRSRLGFTSKANYVLSLSHFHLYTRSSSPPEDSLTRCPLLLGKHFDLFEDGVYHPNQMFKMIPVSPSVAVRMIAQSFTLYEDLRNIDQNMLKALYFYCGDSDPAPTTNQTENKQLQKVDQTLIQGLKEHFKQINPHYIIDNTKLCAFIKIAYLLGRCKVEGQDVEVDNDGNYNFTIETHTEARRIDDLAPTHFLRMLYNSLQEAGAQVWDGVSRTLRYTLAPKRFVRNLAENLGRLPCCPLRERFNVGFMQRFPGQQEVTRVCYGSIRYAKAHNAYEQIFDLVKHFLGLTTSDYTRLLEGNTDVVINHDYDPFLNHNVSEAIRVLGKLERSTSQKLVFQNVFLPTPRVSVIERSDNDTTVGNPGYTTITSLEDLWQWLACTLRYDNRDSLYYNLLCYTLFKVIRVGHKMGYEITERTRSLAATLAQAVLEEEVQTTRREGQRQTLNTSELLRLIGGMIYTFGSAAEPATHETIPKLFSALETKVAQTQGDEFFYLSGIFYEIWTKGLLPMSLREPLCRLLAKNTDVKSLVLRTHINPDQEGLRAQVEGLTHDDPYIPKKNICAVFLCLHHGWIDPSEELRQKLCKLFAFQATPLMQLRMQIDSQHSHHSCCYVSCYVNRSALLSFFEGECFLESLNQLKQWYETLLPIIERHKLFTWLHPSETLHDHWEERLKTTMSEDPEVRKPLLRHAFLCHC